MAAASTAPPRVETTDEISNLSLPGRQRKRLKAKARHFRTPDANWRLNYTDHDDLFFSLLGIARQPRKC
jgi:hypothetical protein